MSSSLVQEPGELCNRLLVTCYMATENSSEDTKNRAKKLAAQVTCTMHHAPCSACTLHPAPCTLHPAPCSAYSAYSAYSACTVNN